LVIVPALLSSVAPDGLAGDRENSSGSNVASPTTLTVSDWAVMPSKVNARRA
jgi:hypothetical protein